VNAELPVLDATRCTGCADCVAVCPTDCLAMNGTTPWMPRPLDCVVCALCVRVCPTDALQMGAGEVS
jgi:NAD-dependent dihydropyrimidine dehydrogenase PreA subunit